MIPDETADQPAGTGSATAVSEDSWRGKWQATY